MLLSRNSLDQVSLTVIVFIVSSQLTNLVNGYVQGVQTVKFNFLDNRDFMHVRYLNPVDKDNVCSPINNATEHYLCQKNIKNKRKGIMPRQEPKEVCPDASAPLKRCFRHQCPYGYYCFYYICCKHLKPGLCPQAFAGGIPAGPPCDCDQECPWIFKCCDISGKFRCVFPENYTAGTVDPQKNV